MNYRKQLKSIRSATDWSQEELATRLNVSFATINSWINGKSEPRDKAKARIEKLYLDTLGDYRVTDEELDKTKRVALSKRISASKLVKNKNLLNKLTLYMTYHTNTIEGSTMTLSDVENVIFDNKVLSNRTSIEQIEARNHQACLHWLINELREKGQNLQIDKDLIYNINLRLMNGIISDAGQIRKHSVRIMGSHVTLLNWHKIPQALDELEEKINEKDSDLIKSIALTHAIFEKIHPFSDGNGRTGRLLMLVQSIKAEVLPPLILKERRFAYYKYLEMAQAEDKYQPLEKFIAESIIQTDKLLKFV